ncbi:MAG: hypothetical protein ACT4PL_01110 [Phycisphaerales bacterium]
MSSTVGRAAAAVLEQCIALLGTLSESQYSRSSVVLPAGTVGKHTRHLLDHFAALLLVPPGTIVEYDHRARNTRDETDRAAAEERCRACLVALEGRGLADDARPVTVRVMLSSSGQEATLASTLGRELAFVAHHAQHHLAMIAAIAREMGASVAPDLGKAPSTVHHERGA